MRNACTSEDDSAARKRFKLARDVKAVEKRIGRELIAAELMLASDQWYWLSQGFLDSGQTREDHFGMFLAELIKVHVPTGEGDTLNKALECVSKLPTSELPVIPGMANARKRAITKSPFRDLLLRFGFRNAVCALNIHSPLRVCARARTRGMVAYLLRSRCINAFSYK